MSILPIGFTRHRAVLAALLALGMAGSPLACGVAAAQTPFYRATPEETAGPPGTLIRSEPMLIAPANAQAWRISTVLPACTANRSRSPG